MGKEYDIRNLGDIFDFDNGWLSDGTTRLFYAVFKQLASARRLKFKIKKEFIEEIRQLYKEDEYFDSFDYIYYEEPSDSDDEEDGEDATHLKEEKYECYVVCKKNLLIGYFDEEITIAYSEIDAKEIERLIALGNQYRKGKDSSTDLYIVACERNYFYLKPSHINQTEIKKETHYNDDFLPVAEEVESFLDEDNKSGLVILHGKQGTGKTSYIRYLIKRSKRKIVYMGGDLIDKLADPVFITFIRRQKDSVFVVEDCEELLASRNGSKVMNSGLVNILNITDGLLGDELCLKFICTFNAPLTDIDTALLRKGRLVARYEFKDLTTEKVNALIEEQGLEIPKQNRPMSLAEIFNYDGQDFTIEKKKIGF